MSLIVSNILMEIAVSVRVHVLLVLNYLNSEFTVSHSRFLHTTYRLCIQIYKELHNLDLQIQERDNLVQRQWAILYTNVDFCSKEQFVRTCFIFKKWLNLYSEHIQMTYQLSELEMWRRYCMIFTLKHCLSVKLKIMLRVVEYYVNNVNITISR